MLLFTLVVMVTYCHHFHREDLVFALPYEGGQIFLSNIKISVLTICWNEKHVLVYYSILTL